MREEKKQQMVKRESEKLLYLLFMSYPQFPSSEHLTKIVTIAQSKHIC